jgi:hypothetical protein
MYMLDLEGTEKFSRRNEESLLPGTFLEVISYPLQEGWYVVSLTGG